MKLSKRTIDDLLTMIQHSRADISFREGGSFNKEDKNCDWPFDPIDAKKVERAIEWIKKLIIQNNV